MHRKVVFCSLLAFASLLVPGYSARAQNLKIEKGFDLFRTLEEFDSEQGFIDCPIPGLVFEENSNSPLTGCDPFMGTVKLKGVPLRKFRGVTVGAVDTIVERTSTLDFGDPDENVMLTVEVELLALNLVSVAPIEVTCNEGLTRWAVKVEVDQVTGPSSGEMDVTLEAPDFEGGTVVSELNVCPRVTFTRVDAGASGSFQIFPCDLQCGPNLLGDTTWAFELDDPDSVLKIPGLTTVNFNFTEQPPDPTDTCPSIYPHQEATAAHLGCQPDPCAQDLEPPDLMVPTPKTCECAAQGGSPVTDACITDWLSEVFCLDELSNSTCSPLNPPNVFPSACGDGQQTVVTFTATDECGNTTSDTSIMTVRDSTGPKVEAGDDDLFCLHPPNHQYRSFDFSDFAPDIADVCGAVADRVFVDCASDQPETGPGDNTENDCEILDDGERFRVRSERSGDDLEGRRYSVEIQATDECGNVGDSEVIGFIHVPHDAPVPPGQCLSPPLNCTVPDIEVTAPPNGQFIDVPLVITDPDGNPSDIEILSISQDEPVKGMGSGNTCPDGEGVGTGLARVRAERNGGGDGRVYHVEFTAEDADGNTCQGVAKVCVPPNNSPGASCVDQGPNHSSTAPCN